MSNPSQLFLFLPAVAALLLGSCSGEEQQASFKVCQSTYALCTTAPCTPVEGDTVSCACEVKTGYSAGQEECQDVKETADIVMAEADHDEVTSRVRAFGAAESSFNPTAPFTTSRGS